MRSIASFVFRARAAAALVLTACSSSATPSAPSTAPLSRDAARQRLVYVASTFEVFIFPAKRNAAPVGEIKDGIYSAYGICLDRYGNLYVVNRYENDVVEYPPGATEPSQKYTQALARPLYPAVDSRGNLWVTNSENGTVVEFAAGQNAATQILQTPGVEADGLAFDPTGNLYVAYRTSSKGTGSIEEFPDGSLQGTILGMTLNQPQGLAVTNTATMLAVEAGKTRRIDVFPPGYEEPILEVSVPHAPGQLAISKSQHTLWVATHSLLRGDVFSSRYPLLNPNGSPNLLHEKIRVHTYSRLLGIALNF